MGGELSRRQMSNHLAGAQTGSAPVLKQNHMSVRLAVLNPSQHPQHQMVRVKLETLAWLNLLAET